MAKQKKNESIKLRSKNNKLKKGTNNLTISAIGNKSNEDINSINRAQTTKKESKDINKKYLLRTKAFNSLEEKAQLKASLSSNIRNTNESKLYNSINEALYIIDYNYNHLNKILENKTENLDTKINFRDNNQQEQSYLEQSNCSTTDLSLKLEEENTEKPLAQKKSKSVRHKKKYIIDLLRLKGHFQEDQYFKLYSDKSIGFKKSEIIREIKEKENDFDVITDEENLKIEKSKVFNNLKKCAKNFIKNPEYLN